MLEYAPASLLHLNPLVVKIVIGWAIVITAVGIALCVIATAAFFKDRSMFSMMGKLLRRPDGFRLPFRLCMLAMLVAGGFTFGILLNTMNGYIQTLCVLSLIGWNCLMQAALENFGQIENPDMAASLPGKNDSGGAHEQ